MQDGQISLVDVDGRLCVVGAIALSNEPIMRLIYWPTAHKTIDLLGRLNVDTLDKLAITRSIPGEYRISAKESFGATVHIQLANGGSTQPCKVSEEPIPAPKRAKQAEYRDGHWHVCGARGWRRV